MKKEILKKTKQLFKAIENCQSDKDILALRTEILKLNYGIINNELGKVCGIYNDMVGAFYDDMHSALVETLWTAICTYDVNKGANLYTYITPYLNAARADVIRSYVTKDTLSEYEWTQYKKMSNMINSGMSKEDIIATGEFGKTSRAVDRMFLVASSNAFPPENSEVTLLSFTDHHDEYRNIENTEWISQIRTLVVKDEYDEYLFNSIIDGTSDKAHTMAKHFHIKKTICESKIDHFYKRLRKAYDELEKSPCESKTPFEEVEDDADFTFSESDYYASEIIDIDNMKKGGKSVNVPKEVRIATVTNKVDASIDIGVKKYIDDCIEEKLDKMSVDEIAEYVVNSLKNR